MSVIMISSSPRSPSCGISGSLGTSSTLARRRGPCSSGTLSSSCVPPPRAARTPQHDARPSSGVPAASTRAHPRPPPSPAQLALVFTAVVTPVEVAFIAPPETADEPLFIINRLVDLAFLIDLVLQFFIA